MNILVIDDERTLADLLVRRLDLAGHVARAAYTGAEGLALAQQIEPELTLCDLRLPDVVDLELPKKLFSHSPQMRLVIMTGGGSTATAVEAMKLGATDYLEKPFKFEALLTLIQKLGCHQSAAMVPGATEGTGAQKNLGAQGIYFGAGMRQVYEDISLAAAQDGVSVLLTGETGSGKEHTARLLHQLSKRFAGPFVEFNCASIPESLVESELFGSEAGSYTDSKRKKIGLFESAQGGTLFLDEIGDLSLLAQAKLLKVLDDQHIKRVGSSQTIKLDLRLVAATNKDLEMEAKAGRFRTDLYYRLSNFVVRLPSLRERPGDIPSLAVFLFEQSCRKYHRHLKPLNTSQLEHLSKRTWEGNVRELKNVIENGVLRAREDKFELTMLEKSGDAPPVPEWAKESFPFRPMKEVVDELVQGAKRGMLLKALKNSGGNRTEAARLLNTDLKTIHNLIKALKINFDEASGHSASGAHP